MRHRQEKTKLSVPELAKKWGVAPGKVTGFIRDGELRAIDLSSASSTRPRWSIDLEDIALFERGREHGKPAPRPPRRQKPQIKEYV